LTTTTHRPKKVKNIMGPTVESTGYESERECRFRQGEGVHEFKRVIPTRKKLDYWKFKI